MKNQDVILTDLLRHSIRWASDKRHRSESSKVGRSSGQSKRSAGRHRIFFCVTRYLDAKSSIPVLLPSLTGLGHKEFRQAMCQHQSCTVVGYQTDDKSKQHWKCPRQAAAGGLTGHAPLEKTAHARFN